MFKNQVWRVAEFNRETGKCLAVGTWSDDRQFVLRVWKQLQELNDNQVIIETANADDFFDNHQYFVQH